MKTVTKIYSAVCAIAIMYMTEYCLCYSDFTAQTLSDSIGKASYINAEKVKFHKNVYGIEDGVLSSTAVEDTLLTQGALYYQYRPVISSNIYLNNQQITFPIDTLGEDFTIKNSISYSENIIVSDLMYKDKFAAKISQDKNGNIYKISCDDFNIKIDTIGIGNTLAEVINRWGEPDIAKSGQLHYYVLEDGITIGFITDGEGNITNISCGLTDEMNEERYGL